MGSTNTAKAAGGTVAAMSVEKVLGGTKGSIAGKIVQPAIWVFGEGGPDAGDVFLYAVSFTSRLVSGAAAATGLLKAYVDDRVAEKVARIAAQEPAKYRKGIRPASEYGFFEQGGAISCMRIAHHGGTVWRVNGTWVYIVDGNGKLVSDYQPKKYDKMIRPILPLQPQRGGGVKWEVVGG